MKTKTKTSTKNKPTTKEVKTVLVLRTCNASLRSRNNTFQWAPVGQTTTAADWKDTSECGNGLHGWLWGSGDWSLKEKGKDITWMVVEVEADKIVDLGGKVKFQSGKTLAVEKSWIAAMGFIRGYASYPVAEMKATGYSGHAAATGYYGHAAATGDSGHAAATGYSGHAAATGYSGHAAATGNSGWAIVGYKGQAKAGKDGCVTLAFHDGKRMRVLVGYVGEDGIKPDAWYVVENGKLKEVV